MTGQLELVIFGFYPVPFSFAIGFFFCKWHLKRLAYTGGEEKYPERIQQVVRKYRREEGVGVNLEGGRE